MTRDELIDQLLHYVRGNIASTRQTAVKSKIIERRNMAAARAKVWAKTHKWLRWIKECKQ